MPILDGLVDEVRKLHEERGISFEKLEFFGLEYREVARYLKGECTLLEMRNQLLCRIRQFAKRQDIFFRKLEREGHAIYWLEKGREPAPRQLVEAFLCEEPLPPPGRRMCETFYGKEPRA